MSSITELHHATGDVGEERKAGERLERLKEELHKGEST